MTAAQRQAEETRKREAEKARAFMRDHPEEVHVQPEEVAPSEPEPDSEGATTPARPPDGMGDEVPAEADHFGGPDLVLRGSGPEQPRLYVPFDPDFHLARLRRVIAAHALAGVNGHALQGKAQRILAEELGA